MLRSSLALFPKRAAFVRWDVAPGYVDYTRALSRMDSEVDDIQAGRKEELVWVLEHPPIYTAGTSANTNDLLDQQRFPVFKTGRGGQYTYHGPGQRIAYVMLDLRQRGGDVRVFVATLEQWLIDTLACFGVQGERREDRVGVWVRHANGEDKIAALGIRVRKGITLHGVSLNRNPDLSHFSGIVPCGVSQHGVTSLATLGQSVTAAELDNAMKSTFAKLFGPLNQTP